MELGGVVICSRTVSGVEQGKWDIVDDKRAVKSVHFDNIANKFVLKLDSLFIV